MPTSLHVHVKVNAHDRYISVVCVCELLTVASFRNILDCLIFRHFYEYFSFHLGHLTHYFSKKQITWLFLNDLPPILAINLQLYLGG